MVTEESWPAVTRESRPWRTNPDLRSPDGRRPNQANRMLREIEVEIPAAIAELTPSVSPDTVARCEQAARELAVLDTQAANLSGLGELLARTEAVASSRIEHVYADMDDYSRALLGERAGEQARATAAATQALALLTTSTEQAAPLSEGTILTAHAALLGDDLVEREWAGHYRTQQNWIGGSDFSPLDAVHVPPPPDLVPGLMTDLVAYANRDDHSAIVQAAIVHAQFESIHPFTDGNGRIGRALISTVLRRRGSTSVVVPPVAAAMLADVDGYFDRLADYRAGDVDAIARYVADATMDATSAAHETSDRLNEITAHWRDAVTARRGSAARRLLDGLPRSPVIGIVRAIALTGASRVGAYRAIDRLVEDGVLDEITGQGRNRIWVAGDIMTELTELERRIGLRVKPSKRWQ